MESGKNKQLMIEIIKEAIETFNLSSLEEFYLDEDRKLRARGFIYDEYTGIYVNEFGLLDFEKPLLEQGQEPVREILDLNVKKPVYLTSLEIDTVILKEAVA